MSIVPLKQALLTIVVEAKEQAEAQSGSEAEADTDPMVEIKEEKSVVADISSATVILAALPENRLTEETTVAS